MTVESLIRMAHAQLGGLQQNIPEGTSGMEFIEMYHQIVDDLEKLGSDLSRFRIPNTAMYELKLSGVVCNSLFLRSKVDGLLNLFDVSKDKIGFLPLK